MLTAATGRKSRSAASDDDDFVEPSDSDMETKSQKSFKSASSRSGSSRRSALSDDDSENEEPVKKSKSKPAAKATADQNGPAATSGTRSFLTAAEQREQNKKNEKKESESPYAFLEDIRDVILSFPPFYNPHPLSLTERRNSPRRSQIRPENAVHPSKGLERFHSFRETSVYLVVS